MQAYKRHDPNNAEEIEYMANLFNCMCSALLCVANRERFLKGEGLQLMILMLRSVATSRLCLVSGLICNHCELHHVV